MLLVLTACITPQWKVGRSDPEVRLEDYRRALRFWLDLDDPRLSNILVVENSGHDLRALKEEAGRNPWGKRVEFLSATLGDKPDAGHYGWAEMKMLDDAFDAGLLSGHFVKATGRLLFPKLPRLLNHLPRSYEFAVDCRVRLIPNPHVTTQLMVFEATFFKEHLYDAKQLLRPDRPHMESLYYDILTAHPDKGLLRWPVNCEPRGVPAHFGTSYTTPRKRLISVARSVGRLVAPGFWF